MTDYKRESSKASTTCTACHVSDERMQTAGAAVADAGEAGNESVPNRADKPMYYTMFGMVDQDIYAKLLETRAHVLQEVINVCREGVDPSRLLEMLRVTEESLDRLYMAISREEAAK